MVPDVFKSSVTVDFDLSEASMRAMSKQLLQEGASYFIYSEDEVIQGFVLVDKRWTLLNRRNMVLFMNCMY